MGCTHRTVWIFAIGIAALLGFSSCDGGSSSGGGDSSDETESTTSPGEHSIVVGGASGLTLRPLLGVNDGPFPAGDPGNADLTAAYQQAGVNMVRTHDYYGPLDMAEMYPDHTADPNDSASFDFTDSDVRFQAILQANCEVYFRLGDSWNNATPPDPAYLSNYVQAAVNVIRHFRSGLWSGFNENIEYVEIWNEPGGSQFWPGYSQSYFRTVYIDIANALRAAFPTLKIGGPGWAPSGYAAPSGQQTTRDFLDAVQAAAAPLDFLSWHVYSNDPESYTTAAQFYRTELDARGFTATESHISEWNTSINGVAAGEDYELRAMARGAAINTAAWIKLQETDVAVSTFYRGNDTAMALPTFYGMFFADGTPKKIGLAFELWSRMAGYPTGLELTAATAPAGLYLLAGRDGSGNLALLVANTSTTATSLDLSFAASTGLDLADFTVVVYEVSDAASGIASATGNARNVSISGETVLLVTLTQ